MAKGALKPKNRTHKWNIAGGYSVMQGQYSLYNSPLSNNDENSKYAAVVPGMRPDNLANLQVLATIDEFKGLIA